MIPQRPAILYALAFPTYVQVFGEPLGNPDVGAHANTAVRIKDAVTGDVVYIAQLNTPTTEVTVTGLTLTPGRSYIMSLRYQNEHGNWSQWAKRFVARVPSGNVFDGFSAATVLREPVSAGATPFQPEFDESPASERPALIDAVTDSGDVIRRPLMSNAYGTTNMRWRLNQADYESQIAFLRECIDQAEAFSTPGDDAASDPVHGDSERLWFPVPGSLRHEQLDTGFWQIEVAAHEVPLTAGSGTFTIGRSFVGSADKIG